MIVVFFQHLKGSLSEADKMRNIVASLPELPEIIAKNFLNVELSSDMVLENMVINQVIYGQKSTRSVYFAWDVHFLPAIGWKFFAPICVNELHSPCTVSAVYFGMNDVLICEYELDVD